MMELIRECAGADREEFATVSPRALLGAGSLPMDESAIGGIIDKVFEKACEPRLVQPRSSPISAGALALAKKRADDPTLTRRFEAFIGGQEVVNASRAE